jgi:1,4-dihydroxy-2-naphthoate octaprenyltransferase
MLRAFIRLGRPQYLLKSALLYSLGASVALYHHHTIDLGWYLFGQLFVSCIHLMTHYCNEYFDLEADRANRGAAGVTGGSRVLVDGLLPPIVSLNAGFVLMFAGVAMLVGMPSGAARWMCLVIVMLGWFYTAPPFKLNHRGLGELCSMVVVDLLCPVLALYLQIESLDPILLFALLPNCIIQYAYMMMMNLADYEGDRAAGKRTLVVALGPILASRLYVLAHAVAYAAIFALWWAGLPGAVVVAVGLTLPLSVWQCKRVLRGEYRVPKAKSSVAWWAANYTTLVAIATNIGLLWSAPIEWNRVSANGGQLLCVLVPAICTGWVLSKLWSKMRIARLSAGRPQ